MSQSPSTVSATAVTLKPVAKVAVPTGCTPGTLKPVAKVAVPSGCTPVTYNRAYTQQSDMRNEGTYNPDMNGRLYINTPKGHFRTTLFTQKISAEGKVIWVSDPALANGKIAQAVSVSLQSKGYIAGDPETITVGSMGANLSPDDSDLVDPDSLFWESCNDPDPRPALNVTL